MSESDSRHFLGSVVYVATEDTSAGFTRWLLIDGQRRVTTLTLLLAALRNHLRETGWTGDEDGNCSSVISTGYVLDRLENHGSNEHTDTGGYSIEHVLPQNPKLPPEWREMLGPDWMSIQETWIHRLENLTLTGYNSTYSDRPFEEKKTITSDCELESETILQAGSPVTCRRVYHKKLGRWPIDPAAHGPGLLRKLDLSKIDEPVAS